MENKGYKKQVGGEENAVKLTEEDIDSFENFKHLSSEEKSELIELVYVLSLALYHLYSKGYE